MGGPRERQEEGTRHTKQEVDISWSPGAEGSTVLTRTSNRMYRKKVLLTTLNVLENFIRSITKKVKKSVYVTKICIPALLSFFLTANADRRS